MEQRTFSGRKIAELRAKRLASARSTTAYEQYLEVENYKTLFQAQLAAHYACVGGRLRVGGMTAREVWNTTTNASDMRWMLQTFAGFDRNGIAPNGAKYFKTNKFWTASAAEIRLAVRFDLLRKYSGMFRSYKLPLRLLDGASQ